MKTLIEELRDRLEGYLFMLDNSGYDSDKEYAKEIRRRCFSACPNPAKTVNKDCGYTLATCPYERCSGITMRKEEPLAVLADRKGYEFRAQNYNRWEIILGSKKHIYYREFGGTSYNECDNNARQYLEGLPDKETK